MTYKTRKIKPYCRYRGDRGKQVISFYKSALTVRRVCVKRFVYKGFEVKIFKTPRSSFPYEHEARAQSMSARQLMQKWHCDTLYDHTSHKICGGDWGAVMTAQERINEITSPMYWFFLNEFFI